MGCYDTVKEVINVRVRKLQAGFTVDKDQTTCPPLATTFSDASTVENTTISDVVWDFGDGSNSIIKSPVKTFFYPGDYDVYYKISNSSGCSDSILLPGKIKIGGPRGTPNIDKDRNITKRDALFFTFLGSIKCFKSFYCKMIKFLKKF